MAKQDLRLAKAGNMIHRDFWKIGIPVFPLYRFNVDGFCECGQDDCEVAGKHPRASSWQHTPIWDEDQMDTAEEYGQYDTGYGVLCRGLIVVDVDARNGGVSSYEKLLSEIPELDTAGLTVTTGSGGGSQHVYFRAPADVSMVTHLADYPGIDFKSSGYVVGPGSAHKSGGVYVADGYPEDITEAPQSLIDLLKRPERHRSEYDGHTVDLAHEDIADMLAHIPNNDLPYEEWISIGMAIHHATDGSGFDLWDRWSASSGKHDAKQMQYKWGSFRRSSNPVTVGTLIHYASQNGWFMPVTFSPDSEALEELSHVVVPAPDGLPFDISGVDLTAPPGFVGEVAKWLASQSQFPRKNLAVGGALFAVGNIGGLRYVDDTSDVTSNLLVFCIAESGTGKEGILQGAIALMREAGLAKVCYGRIKSDKEFLNNCVRHQAVVYTLDEFGEFLKKVETARTKGTASYLEGIYGRIMEIFSKAGPGKVLPLGGDDREEVRVGLEKQLSQFMKQAEDHNSPFLEARIESTQKLLDMLENGISRPFLSLLGVTTPNLFEDLMTPEMARSGFIGRAMLFNERINVPEGVFGHTAPPIQRDMVDTLRAIWNGGTYDLFDGPRVENYDEPTRVPSTQGATDMLNAIHVWRYEKAKGEEEETGLHTLWNRLYESVAKVSLILGIPGQLRTEEHVRWAFALVKRDIEEKIRLVASNRTGMHEKADALTERLLAIIGEETMTEAQVYNRVRGKYDREIVYATFDKIVKRGLVDRHEKKHATKKSMVMWLSGKAR